MPRKPWEQPLIWHTQDEWAAIDRANEKSVAEKTARYASATAKDEEAARRRFRQSEDTDSGPYMSGAKHYRDGEGGEK